MSYNIDTWKTKKIENFRVPLAAFFTSDRSDWHPKRRNNDNGTVTLVGGCETCEIHGTLEGDDLAVTTLDIQGEGSGTFMREVLEPAFAQSRGLLIASQVWEGGDSITRLAVMGGEVSWEDIEL